MVEATAKSAKPSYRMRLAESLNLPILCLNRMEKNRNGVGVYFHKQKKKDCNYSAAKTRDSILFEEGKSSG